MGALGTLLLSKGLPILASALFNKVINWKKIGDKVGIRARSEDDLAEKIERQGGLTQEQYAALNELQYATKLEEEVTKRLEIDDNADSWFTKHIRPLMLIFVSVSTIIYLFTIAFISFDLEKLGVVEAFGNYLFMLNGGMFSFYFGGRSWEKIQSIKVKPQIKAVETSQKVLTGEVNPSDIPKI